MNSRTRREYQKHGHELESLDPTPKPDEDVYSFSAERQPWDVFPEDEPYVEGA